MERYLVPILILFFIVFGITMGTTYAAESESIQSNNTTAVSHTTSQEAPSVNAYSTNKDTAIKSDAISHNDDTSSSSQTTPHPDVATSTTQHTTSEKHNASSQGSAFSDEKALPEPTTNEVQSSQDTKVNTSSSTTEASKSVQVTSPKASTPAKATSSPEEATQQQSHDVAISQHATPVSKQALKHSDATSKQTAMKTNDVTANKKATTASNNKDKHTILHTNDIHGRFVEEDGRVIGMAKVKGLKDKYHPDLMVDSGDAFQGLPVSNNSKGEEMAKAMNHVGYDAMTVGNHEFDFGYDQLLKLQKQLNFPIISSNIYKNGKRIFNPSTIVTKNNVRYGIVGVTTPETKTKTSPSAVEGVEFKDPLTSVKQAMNQIKNHVDIFVVLSHLGVDKSTQERWRGDYLIKQLTKDRSFTQSIFVLDGHSHTVIDHGQHYGANNILAQTGTALENVGRIDFNFKDKQATNVEASLINVADAEHVTPDSQIEAQTKKANDAFLKATSTVVIPNNTVKLNGERAQARTQETNLGNLITDAMEAYASKHFSHPSDFAITNGGGIRASIDKGKVTENDIITVLPFGNLISQIQVKGSDVLKAFEHSLSADTETQDDKKVLGANGGFLQISDSLKVYYDIDKASGQRINAIKVLNKENGRYEDLDPNRTYYVTTNDFTANQGDGYDMFGGQREEGISLDEVVAQYIKETDLSKYDTVEPVRIINGEPESAEQPNTGEATQDSNNHSTGHAGSGQQMPNNNTNDDSKHNSHHGQQPAHKDTHQANGNIIELPNVANGGHQQMQVPLCTNGKHHHNDAQPMVINTNHTSTHHHCGYPVASNHYNKVIQLSNHAFEQHAGAYHMMHQQNHHTSNAIQTMALYNESLIQLPNTGNTGDTSEHGIAILLVVTGTGLIYCRQRKKSA